VVTWTLSYILIFCLGEKLYIGHLTPNYTPNIPQKYLFIPGIITPSQNSFTFCDYNSHKKKLSVETVRLDEAPCYVLTSKIPDILYWEPSERFAFNHSLPHNVLMMDTVIRTHTPCLLFIARVPPTVVH